MGIFDNILSGVAHPIAFTKDALGRYKKSIVLATKDLRLKTANAGIDAADNLIFDGFGGIVTSGPAESDVAAGTSVAIPTMFSDPNGIDYLSFSSVDGMAAGDSLILVMSPNYNDQANVNTQLKAIAADYAATPIVTAGLYANTRILTPNMEISEKWQGDNTAKVYTWGFMSSSATAYKLSQNVGKY